ncbi:hypothetical protein CY34DRAFT_109825 [Suillus luteus UH-Slu-Lm8-n1]|uniref:Uncharacterized protein n=1 Tax=Suillus luteus UH-Slu-Lm8-n1 TaxID=930992 RepID=A0A0D0A1J7_9AGAM|nr:hypothetical protein CY34DRAFT_109825 [Suillus luteus UH-Slu-Lm8-n1]
MEKFETNQIRRPPFHANFNFNLTDGSSSIFFPRFNCYALSSFIYGLKSQFGDQTGLGGKIDDDDKKTILAAIKETMEWIDDNGQGATTEEFAEKLLEIQEVVNPITSKLRLTLSMPRLLHGGTVSFRTAMLLPPARKILSMFQLIVYLRLWGAVALR